MRARRLTPDEVARTDPSLLVGAVLIASASVPGRRLAKGTRLDAATAHAIASAAGSGQLSGDLRVVWPDADDMHEDEAAERLALAVGGAGVDQRPPHQSLLQLVSKWNGVLHVRHAALAALNQIESLEVFTLFDGQCVEEGDVVAAVKVVPHVLPAETVRRGVRLAREEGPLVEVRPYQPLHVAAIVCEPLSTAARERFELVADAKLTALGASFAGVIDAWDADPAVATERIGLTLRALADEERHHVVLVAGVSAGDPLSPFGEALSALGGRFVRLGLPAHPGSMLWLAELGHVRIPRIARMRHVLDGDRRGPGAPPPRYRRDARRRKPGRACAWRYPEPRHALPDAGIRAGHGDAGSGQRRTFDGRAGGLMLFTSPRGARIFPYPSPRRIAAVTLQTLSDYQRLIARNEPIGRAVVTQVWGSAPRRAGAVMLATPSGAILGSVSGGCVENAVAQEIAEAATRGTARLVTYGVADETAWEVGLSCGGTISVLIEPAVRPPCSRRRGVRAAWWSPPSSRHPGSSAPPISCVMMTAASRSCHPWVRRAMSPARPNWSSTRCCPRWKLLRSMHWPAGRAAPRRSPLPEGGKLLVLLEVFPRQPRLVIFGGVHIAQALTLLGRALGYRTYVADGRAAWLTRERFPDADELVLGWPEEAFERIGLDARTYVVLLSHDPKFDEPATEIALRSPVPYIGTIGSRKTQEKRRARLRDAGFTEVRPGAPARTRRDSTLAAGSPWKPHSPSSPRSRRSGTARRAARSPPREGRLTTRPARHCGLGVPAPAYPHGA